MSIRRRDTPEARAYWDFIDREVAIVHAHDLCLSSHCVVDGGACKHPDTGKRRSQLAAERDAKGAEIDALRARLVEAQERQERLMEFVTHRDFCLVTMAWPSRPECTCGLDDMLGPKEPK